MGLIIIFVILALVAWSLTILYYLIFLGKRRKLLASTAFSGLDRNKEKFIVRLQRLIIKIGHQFAPVGKHFTILIKNESLKAYLSRSGNYYNLAADDFLGLCFVLAITGLILGNIMVFIGFPLAGLLQLLLLLIGFFGPLFWLRQAVNKRQEKIGLALPNYLDAVSVILHAGISLDSAMQYIILQTEGPLGEELSVLQREIELGVPKDDAYKRLAGRNSNLQLERMVHSLIQGNKLGVPVATTFKVLSDDMRISRINKLKEKAGQASPKVTLVTSFVILPAVLMFIFGLLVLNLFYNPQGIGLQGLLLN